MVADLHRIARKNALVELENVNPNDLDINATDKFGATPLQLGIAHQSTDVVAWLLDAGADVTLQDREGKTALHAAVEYSMVSVAEAVIRKNPEVVDIPDVHGNQPLWVAVFKARGDFELVELLLRHGADPTHKNKADMSPVDMARRKKNFELLELLS